MTCSKNIFQLVNLFAIKPSGTLGLCCAYIAQLLTYTVILHMVVYLAVMSLKPLGIFQRVIKSQKVNHISNKKTEKNLKDVFTKKCFFDTCGF